MTTAPMMETTTTGAPDSTGSTTGESSSTGLPGGETTATPETAGSGECPAGTLLCPCGSGCEGELSCVGGLCQTYACGNGVVEPGEDCDDGDVDVSDECLPGCVAASCGDGFVHVGVETCDAGAQNSPTGACRADCTPRVCGDGNIGPGEACDDGNNNNADGCSNACAMPGCGDMMVVEPEQCDDANAINTDACLSSCVLAICGDGIVQDMVEECDDGDADDNDACVAGCKQAECGDGFVQAGVEQCDDANVIDNDGCSNDCVRVVLKVGQYDVHSGPAWYEDPPTYSCKEACAQIFGGMAGDYVCSIEADTPSGTAYVSGWGDGEFCATPKDDDYKVNVTYDCGGPGCAYSAYVMDHCDQGTSINYCWKP
ncbi:MAG: DUF4215 domain-containing protein [Myxococcales bacterium]|nr:DUF4215 domain-containing protein [Myxococcales bacterium]